MPLVVNGFPTSKTLASGFRQKHNLSKDRNGMTRGITLGYFWYAYLFTQKEEKMSFLDGEVRYVEKRDIQK